MPHVTAHIAELCRRFPLDSKSSGNDVERWHERVLFLEDELRAVKRKADADAAGACFLLIPPVSVFFKSPLILSHFTP